MDKEKQDIKYMKKVINIAKKGEGYTSPNPMVGALVVKDDEIVGQGYHHFFGDAHAEVNALEEAGDMARNAILYVNLEPCCHYGKTPPCYHKIIEAGIKKVVIGMEDPNPKVSGKGIMYLRKAGIEVKTGVLEKEVKRLNEAFIKYISSDIPFLILKTAQTLDGYLATREGDSKWITNEKARNYGHKLRHRADCILVGSNTVLNDDPRLTTRLPDKKGKDSLRVVLDEDLKTPTDARIINQNSTENTILAAGTKLPGEKRNEFESHDSVELKTFSLDKENKIPLKDLLQYLHDEQAVTTLLVEGGGTVNYSLLQQNLIDKIYMFISPKIMGGNDGVSVFQGKGPAKIKETTKLKNIELEKIDDNFLLKGYLN